MAEMQLNQLVVGAIAGGLIGAGLGLCIAANLFGRPTPRPKLHFTVKHKGATFHGVTKMILKPGFKIKLLALALKADGTPGRIDGAISWSPGEGNDVVRLEPAFINDDEAQGQDPMAIWAVAGTPGVTQVSGVADIDLGDGVDNVTGFLDVTVPDEEVATFAIQAGEPVPV